MQRFIQYRYSFIGVQPRCWGVCFVFVPRMAVSVLSLLHATQWTKFGVSNKFIWRKSFLQTNTFLPIPHISYLFCWSPVCLEWRLLSQLSGATLRWHSASWHSATRSLIVFSQSWSLLRTFRIFLIFFPKRGGSMLYLFHSYFCITVSSFPFTTIQIYKVGKNFERRHFKKIITAWTEG